MNNLNLKNIKSLKIKIFSFITLVAVCLIFSASAYASYEVDCAGKNINCSAYDPESCRVTSGGVAKMDRCCTWDNARKAVNSEAGKTSCFDSTPIGMDKVTIGSAPGIRRGNGDKGHTGYDYSAPVGTPALAPAYGVVSRTSACSNGAGRVVEIKHPKATKDLAGKEDFYTSQFMHLARIDVSTGSKVNKGQPIGLVGGSNCAAGKTIEAGQCLGGGQIYASDKKASNTEKVTCGYVSHMHFGVIDSNGDILDPNCPSFDKLCGGNFGTGYKDYQFTPFPEYTPPVISGTASPTLTGNVNSNDSPPMGTGECNINKYRDSFKTCVFCDIFEVLFNTASDIAKKAFKALADGISKLILVGLAIWLSINIVKYVSAMEQKEPKTFIKEIFNQIFIVLMIYIFLKSDSSTFFGLAMEPIFNTGMKLAQMATGTETCTDTFKITKTGGLPASMGISILCTIKSIQGEILDIMALGSTAMCVGFFIESYFNVPIFPHLGYVIVGLLLWISALLLMIIYPFLLIDSVLQLSVACALLPAAIGAYAFKITQKYVGKIWETFLNCMFTFVFLAIIIFILTSSLKSIIGDTFVGGLKNAGIDSDYSIILNQLAWWGTTFLKLIFIMILGWAVLGEAQSFAGTFAGSVGVGGAAIGSSVGALAMSGAKAVGKPVAAGAGKAINSSATAVGRTANEKYNNAKVGFQAWQIKNNSNAKTDTDGNISVTSKNMFGKQTTKVLSTDATGKQSISKTKTNKDGSSTTTKTDAFMSVKENKDSNGNVTSRQTEMKAAGAKYMINKDGSTNQVALNALRNNSQHSPDVVNEAILNQMLKERMPGIEGATLNGSFKERSVRSFKNDKGQDVFEISQTNKDGSKSNFRMSMSGNRALTEYEVISKNGSAKSFASDGIINKKSSYKYNNDGANGALGTVNSESVKNKFSFTSHYQSRDSRPMDSNGVISNSVPQDEILFGTNDMAAFQDQIANNGQAQPLSGFK